MDELIENKETFPGAFNKIKTNNHRLETRKLVFLLIITIPSFLLYLGRNKFSVCFGMALLPLLLWLCLLLLVNAFKVAPLLVWKTHVSCHSDFMYKFVTKLNKLDQVPAEWKPPAWSLASSDCVTTVTWVFFL